MEEYKKDWWIWLIIIFFALINIITLSISGIISLIIGFACGNKCVDWSIKINKNKNWAFLIGFFFGLFGLLGYWLYCGKRLK